MRITGSEEIVYRKLTPHSQWQRTLRFDFDDAIEVEAPNVPEAVRFALVARDRKALRGKGKEKSHIG